MGGGGGGGGAYKAFLSVREVGGRGRARERSD